MLRRYRDNYLEYYTGFSFMSLFDFYRFKGGEIYVSILKKSEFKSFNLNTQPKCQKTTNKNIICLTIKLLQANYLHKKLFLSPTMIRISEISQKGNYTQNFPIKKK